MEIVFYPLLVFLDPKPFLFVESRDLVSELMKNGGNHREPVTARFVAQESGKLRRETRRSNPVMSLLAEVTEAAVVLAEMQTQPGSFLIAVDNVTVAAREPTGHISKKITVETG